MSTNTGVAPTWHITLHDAVYVYADVITSSPGPTPNTLNVISIAAVDEFKHTVFSVLHNSVIFCSNNFVFGPVVIHPDFIASITSSISASPTSGGENLMFILFSIFQHSFLHYNFLFIMNKF